MAAVSKRLKYPLYLQGLSRNRFPGDRLWRARVGLGSLHRLSWDLDRSLCWIGCWVRCWVRSILWARRELSGAVRVGLDLAHRVASPAHIHGWAGRPDGPYGPGLMLRCCWLALLGARWRAGSCIGYMAGDAGRGCPLPIGYGGPGGPLGDIARGPPCGGGPRMPGPGGPIGGPMGGPIGGPFGGAPGGPL